MIYREIKGVMADGITRRTVQVDAEGRLLIAPRASRMLKKITVRKALEANGSAHSAGDVLSETDTNGAGTAWTFKNAARVKGGSGYIVQATAQTQVEAQTYQVAMQIYTATPTCELDDNAAAASPNPTDATIFVDEILLPALHARGDNSYTVATPSTTGNLPLAFVCNSDSRDLEIVAITADNTTHTATEWLELSLYIMQD